MVPRYPSAWTADRSIRSLVSLSASSSIAVRLPAGDSIFTMVHLSVRVRDQFGCSFEFDMSPVSITPDTTSIAMLINALQSTSSHSDALVQTLVNGNQNEMNQALMSFSRTLNTMSIDALRTTLMSAANIPVTALSASSLDHPWTLVSDGSGEPFVCRSSHLFPSSSTVRLHLRTRR